MGEVACTTPKTMVHANGDRDPAEPDCFVQPLPVLAPWGPPDVSMVSHAVARPSRTRTRVPFVVLVVGMLATAAIYRLMLSGLAAAPSQVVPEPEPIVSWSAPHSVAEVGQQVHTEMVQAIEGPLPIPEKIAFGPPTRIMEVAVAAPSPSKRWRPTTVVKKSPKVLTMPEWRVKLQKLISDECSIQAKEPQEFAVLHTITQGRVTRVDVKHPTGRGVEVCATSLLNDRVGRGWTTSTEPLPSGEPREYKYSVEPRGV